MAIVEGERWSKLSVRWTFQSFRRSRYVNIITLYALFDLILLLFYVLGVLCAVL